MADRRREIIILDTHIWIWAVDRSPRLSSAHFDLLNEYMDFAAISAASLWEVSMLVSKGRLTLSLPLRAWFDLAIATMGMPILPLTPDIAREAYELPGTFHDDPADRMIVATARVHNYILLSEDSKILNYPHVIAR